MKKEAINSFNDGLIKDLNELNTPNTALSDCLNGTMITYNGNEFSLQNDMGNAKLPDAFLKDGYVPVGMKEYGGIIYVAAYNPETKKGQIGSFPSPQQLFYNEDNDENNHIEGIMQKLLSISDIGALHIINEFYKVEISKNILHSGDRFLLYSTSELNDTVKRLVEKGILTFKLAILSNDGNLKYIDDKLLNIQDNDTFIYEKNEEEEVQNILALKNNKYYKNIQTLNSSSSGNLYLIAEYNTYDTMSVSHSITLKDINTYKITTTATVSNALPIYASPPATGYSNLILFDDNDKKIESTLSNGPTTFSYTEELSAGSITKTIYAGSAYGILDRLSYTYSFNYAELKKGMDDLTFFNYEVKDGYIDITYGYKYFNPYDEVSGISFTLYSIDEIENTEEDINYDEATGKIDLGLVPGIGLSEAPQNDSYIGLWTFSSKFSDDIKENTIYICEICRTTKGKNTKYYYRTIITSPVLNTMGYVNSLEVPINVSLNVKLEKVNSSYTIKDTINGNEVGVIKADDLISGSLINYSLLREVQNEYAINNDVFSIADSVIIDNNSFARDSFGLNISLPKNNVIFEVGISRDQVTDDPNSNLYINKDDEVTKKGENITVTMYRKAYCEGKEATSTGTITVLEPMCKKDPSSDYNYFSMFSVYGEDYDYGPVIGGNSKGYKTRSLQLYNNPSWGNMFPTNLGIPDKYDEADFINWNDACRDHLNFATNKDTDYISMAILAGWPSKAGNADDDASFRTDGIGGGAYSWDHGDSDHEVDSGRNWRMLAMRTPDNYWYLVNLGSPIATGDTGGAAHNCTSLVYLVRSIFSQILLPVTKTLSESSYIPDTSTYSQTDIESKLTISCRPSGNSYKLDILTRNSISYDNIVTTFKKIETNYPDNINLLFPEFKVNLDNETQTINIGKDIMSLEDSSVKIIFANVESNIPKIEQDPEILKHKDTFYLGEFADINNRFSDDHYALLKIENGRYVAKSDDTAELEYGNVKQGNSPEPISPDDTTAISIRRLRDSFITAIEAGIGDGSKNTLFLRNSNLKGGITRTTWMKHESYNAYNFIRGIHFGKKIAFREIPTDRK